MVLMAIECPEGVEPGQALLVGGPDGEDVEVVVPEGVASGDTFEVDVGGDAEAEDAPPDDGWTPRSGMIDVEVPEGVEPGQVLLVTAPDGTDVEVVVPEGLSPGDTFQVSLDGGAKTPQPAAAEEEIDEEDWGEEPAADEARELQEGQVMAIEVPEGVEPGQALLVTAPDGTDVEVVVPEGLSPGDTFQVSLGGSAEPEAAEPEAEAMEPPEEVKKEFKLIMLGAAGAGKSCLVSRLLKDEFSDAHTPTLGMEHEKHVLTSSSNKRLKLQIWDRAGVATYGAIEKAYWKKATGAMLVYDSSDRESFDYLMTAAKEVRASGKTGMPLMVVGNKIDLDPQAVEGGEAEGLCASLAESFGLSSVPFVEASASDSFNVEEAFAGLADLAYQTEFASPLAAPEDDAADAEAEAEAAAAAEAETAAAAEEEAEAAAAAEAEAQATAEPEAQAIADAEAATEAAAAADAEVEAAAAVEAEAEVQAAAEAEAAAAAAAEEEASAAAAAEQEAAAAAAAEAAADAEADAAAVGTKLAEALPQPTLVLPDRAGRRTLFNKIDNNGNGGLSLAEIDKAVVAGVLGEALGVPDFNHKPVLMRAYRAADASHDGYIERNEFSKLLSYLVYFNNLWHKFEEIDSDHDRRIDATEFAAGCVTLGLELSEVESATEFAAVDTDGGEVILFVEFCAWVAKREAEAIEHEHDEPEPEPEPEQVDEAAAAAAAAVEKADAPAKDEETSPNDKGKGKKNGGRFGIQSPVGGIRSPLGRKSSSEEKPAEEEAAPEEQQEEDQVVPDEPAPEDVAEPAAESAKEPVAEQPEEKAATAEEPPLTAADGALEQPEDEAAEPALPAHAALVVALTADTAEPMAQAELEQLIAMTATGQEPPVEVSLLIELSATLAKRLEAGVTPQVQLKALQLLGALSSRSDPRLGPLFLRDLSGFVAASAAFDTAEPDAEHGDKPKLMVRKSARKCLGELAASHPTKLGQTSVELLNEMTADNDQTVQTAGIDTLTEAVTAGGSVAASELSLLLTGRLADEATSVKLKALRLLMVLESKCGPDLTGYVSRDAVQLLGATTVWQCPPDPKHGEKPMIMVQKAARKCLDQHTKRAAKNPRKPPMVKWGMAGGSPTGRKQSPKKAAKVAEETEAPREPKPAAAERPKVPGRRPPAKTHSTQSPGGLAANETPRERREAKAKARREEHEAKKMARQDDGSQDASTRSVSSARGGTPARGGGPPKRPPPTPPTPPSGMGETEFARKQEERARRRTVAEAAQKKKVNQQKQFAQAEARKRNAGAEERKRRREEAAAERKAELRRGRKSERGAGGAPPSQIPTRRPGSAPGGHAGGLSTFLTRQADFDEERKMKLQAKKDEVMAKENVHLQSRPKVNTRKSLPSASPANSSEDFLERQRMKQEERAERLTAKRLELRRAQVAGTPRLTPNSLEIARHMAGPRDGRTSSMERLTRANSPRALEKMEAKKQEIAKKEVVTSFQMNDRSRDIVVQKYGDGAAASHATMNRLTQPTKSYGKKKLAPGSTKEVVVYRGWSRHVEYVPVDQTGRVSISPRLQNTRFTSELDEPDDYSNGTPIGRGAQKRERKAPRRSVSPATGGRSGRGTPQRRQSGSRAAQRPDRNTRKMADMYDHDSEIAQAKRDCIALAEEVQRLRDEVNKERSGRKKAMAGKRQAEGERDDAVAALVAAGGRPPLPRRSYSGGGAVEEGAPPESPMIPEGAPPRSSSFERAEAEASGWDDDEVSAIQAQEDDDAIAGAASQATSLSPAQADAGDDPEEEELVKPAPVKVAGRRKVRPPPKIPEGAGAL